MKIVHLTSGSMNSGASKGAYILHKKLLSKKINSYLINDAEVMLNQKKIIFVNHNFLLKIKYALVNIINKLPKIFYYKRKTNAFDNSLLGIKFTNYNLIKKADILHLHWISKSFSDLSYLKKFNKPIIWTLRDMWAFTGGCHYSLSCNKFKKKCGKCLSLNSNSKKDLSYWNQKIKIKNYKDTDINYVAISMWLKKEASKSLLLRNKKIETIYNGINGSNFYPIKNLDIKRKKDIPLNKKIILFGSQYIDSEYKGFNYLVESLKFLDTKKYFLITFGKIHNLKYLDSLNIEYKNFNFINNHKELNEIYNLADVFVASSVQEAFGKTIVESLMSGTPVVCFKKTAISEIVKHKKNGYCAKYLDSKDIAKGIDWVSKNYKKFNDKRNLQKNKSFTDDYMAKKYISLYKKVYKKS